MEENRVELAAGHLSEAPVKPPSIHEEKGGALLYFGCGIVSKGRVFIKVCPPLELTALFMTRHFSISCWIKVFVVTK